MHVLGQLTGGTYVHKVSRRRRLRLTQSIWLRLKRPGFVLGLLLSIVWLVFFAFCWWQANLPPKDALQKFQSQQWVLLVAALAATSGWIVTSWMGVRNSVKQHTINTLLQSRLSIEYMKHASTLGRHYKSFSEQSGQQDTAQRATDGLDEESLQYVLNYFEFIAIGIRAGDLHEGLLRGSLRSIVCRNVEMSKDWIDDCRAKSPRLYENLGWLQNRWNPGAPQITKHNGTIW